MYLIYLLFGKNTAGLKSELVYSLLSFVQVTDEHTDIRIIIYCQEPVSLPACLEKLNIQFVFLTQYEIDTWVRRSHGHTLVLKAQVMHRFLQTFSAPGIMIDTDTYFVKDPVNLFNALNRGDVVMHLREYYLDIRPRICSFFKRHTFKRLNGDHFKVYPDFYMWNSGVVGLHPSYIHLPDIISFIEQVSAYADWPAEEHRLIEQTAYSYYLQQQGINLLPASDYVMHYWFFKQIRYLLGYCFGYFHGSDQAEFDQLVVQQNVPVSVIENLTYEEVPYLMVQLMKEYDVIENYHYECLPAGTGIGKILRMHTGVN